MRTFKDYTHNDQAIKGFFGDYRWLSNFQPCRIEYRGLLFSAVEQPYQAEKAGGIEVLKQFCLLEPGQAKREGRKLIMRPDWDSVKLQVMETLLLLKFSNNNPDLCKKLIATGDKYLEETNHWNDTFWGVCKGKGENNLGKLLMKIRTQLKANVL